MIFFEYFKRYIGKSIKVTLKTDMVLSGTLINVDNFLNLQLENTKVIEQTQGFSHLDLCSIRGSSVKFVELERSMELEDRLIDATLLRFSFDK